MTVIGCTGHQALSVDTQGAVAQAIVGHLRRFGKDGELEGVCSLAVGADQIFASALLGAGGRLRVILPCAGYESTFSSEQDHARYSELLASAVTTEQLPYASPSEEAFMAAGRIVTDRSRVLLAVWDGAPAAGLGGTADVVQYAKEQGKAVEIIWPPGARRT